MVSFPDGKVVSGVDFKMRKQFLLLPAISLGDVVGRRVVGRAKGVIEF